MPTKIYQPSWTEDIFTSYVPPDMNLLERIYSTNQTRANKIMDENKAYQLEMSKQQLNARHDQMKENKLAQLAEDLKQFDSKNLGDTTVQREIEKVKNKYLNDTEWVNAVRSTKEAETMLNFQLAHPEYIDKPWLLNTGDYNAYTSGQAESYKFTPPKANMETQKVAQELIARINPDDRKWIQAYGDHSLQERALVDKSAKMILDRMKGVIEPFYNNNPNLKAYLEGQASYENRGRKGIDYLQDALNTEAVIQGSTKSAVGIPQLSSESEYGLKLKAFEAAQAKATQDKQNAITPIFTALAPTTRTENGVTAKLRTYQINPDGIGEKLINHISQQVENNQKPLIANTSTGKKLDLGISNNRASVFDKRVIQTGPTSFAAGNMSYMKGKEMIEKAKKQGFDVNTIEELISLIPGATQHLGKDANGQIKNSIKFNGEDVVIAFPSTYEGLKLRDPQLHSMALDPAYRNLEGLQYDKSKDEYVHTDVPDFTKTPVGHRMPIGENKFAVKNKEGKYVPE